MPAANPRQLCAHWLKSFPNFMIIFRDFQDFVIYLAKYFLSLLNSPKLTFQLLSYKSKVNETV